MISRSKSEAELGFPPPTPPAEAEAAEGGKGGSNTQTGAKLGERLCLRCGGWEEGVRTLMERFPTMATVAGEAAAAEAEASVGEEQVEEGEEGDRIGLGRVFVVGGAEVYKAVLEGGGAERILWTRLRGEWECDTWFPRGALPGGDNPGAGGGPEGRWVQRSREEMERWVGEEGVGGVKKEGEVEFEIMMWEREKGGKEK